MDERKAAAPAAGAGLLHAYIVASENEEERFTRALALAASMVCESPGKAPCRVCRHCRKVFNGIHPDVTIIERPVDDKGNKRREIYVEQIRAIVSDAYVLPGEAARKVYIIKDAGAMNVFAQNAFLKLLEEPPPYAAFLLCVGNPDLLLPTVRSRCTLLRTGMEETPLPPGAIELARAYLQAVASGDPVLLLRQCVALEALDSASASDFAEAVRYLVCQMLCRREDALGLERSQLLAQERLLARVSEYLRMHVGVRHVCGLLAVQQSIIGGKTI